MIFELVIWHTTSGDTITTDASIMPGCCANAAPFCADGEGSVATNSTAGRPACTVIADDCTDENPGAVNASVRTPATPVIVRKIQRAL